MSKQMKRPVEITEANPPSELSCLGKKSFPTEAQAVGGKGIAYFCGFCQGWHRTRRGHKGKKRF